MNNQRVNVLVVEDSKSARMLLVHILRSDPTIHVVGAVQNGLQALQFLGNATPDVIVMDLEMPKMNGLDATRKIMETRPVPIVICSATNFPHNTVTTFRSMEAGALACVEKPVGIGHHDFPRTAKHLLETVKLMSEVKLVRRWPKAPDDKVTVRTAIAKKALNTPVEVIGIGASTGGPPVLHTILAGLPDDFVVPILVVQHIARGFLPGLVQWLSQATRMRVQIATHETLLLPRNVYLAPDDFQMGVAPGGRIVLTKDQSSSNSCPSIAHLFESLAAVYGARSIGVMLTGMGKDGARELGRMKSRGGCTIAQDRATSVVHGMAGEAIALDAATWVLPAEKIAPALTSLTRPQSISGGRHEYCQTNA